jgi:hypothetical protein
VPLKIVKKPKKVVSSNKEETLESGIQAGSQSPIVQLPSASAPKLFIDRLSIVLNISDAVVAHDAYNEMMKDQDDKEVLIDGGSKTKWGTFKWAKRIVLNSVVDHQKLPLLQCEVDKPNKCIRRLRIDFVPIDLGPAGISDLEVAFGGWFDQGWQVLTKGTISRLDVAVDVSDATLADVHLLPQQGATARQWGVDGVLQTFIHGKPHGNQTTIYERKAKRIAQKKPWIGKEGLRFERRLKKLNKKAGALLTLPNPLKSINLIHLPSNPPPGMKQPYIWALFCRAVEASNLPSALALLPVHVRTEYREHIAANTVPWWDADGIWDDWPSVVSQLRL